MRHSSQLARQPWSNYLSFAQLRKRFLPRAAMKMEKRSFDYDVLRYHFRATWWPVVGRACLLVRALGTSSPDRKTLCKVDEFDEPAEAIDAKSGAVLWTWTDLWTLFALLLKSLKAGFEELNGLLRTTSSCDLEFLAALFVVT
jgi:hypothetical protein